MATSMFRSLVAIRSMAATASTGTGIVDCSLRLTIGSAQIVMCWGPKKRKLQRLKSTLAVAMSGGIDSSVAAMLLKDKGYDCVGVFMKNWDPDDETLTQACTLDSDRDDMIQVCKRLDMPYVEVNFVKEYWTNVFEPLLDGYVSGIATPNPDVECNRFIKFDALKKYINKKLGIQQIATGHYARLRSVSSDGGECQIRLPSVELMAAVDSIKDQSYFLCRTRGQALLDVQFPLGSLHKHQVKALAAERLRGCRVLEKKESMGVCFIGKRDFGKFLTNYITPSPGRMVDIDTGNTVGRHNGKELFTIGQGACVGGAKTKYFVALRVPNSSDLVVASGTNHPALFTNCCYTQLTSFSWIAGHPPLSLLQTKQGLALKCKIRSTSQPMACWVSLETEGSLPPTALRWNLPLEQLHGSSSEAGLNAVTPNLASTNLYLKIQFEAQQRAVTPGQVVALYEGEVCLGGGVMCTIASNKPVLDYLAKHL